MILLRFSFSNLLLLLFTLLVSGCLSNASKGTTETSEYIETSQVQYYTQSILDYSITATNSLTNNDVWTSGGFAFDGANAIIDDSTFRTPLGYSFDSLRSGFCVEKSDKSLKGYHITWYESSDKNYFRLKGIGKNSKARILAELSQHLPASSFGYKSDIDNISYSDGNLKPLPKGCDLFPIPLNSPVVLTEIGVPQLPAGSVTKTEYTTAPCESGKVGHYLLSINITTLPDGTRIAAGQSLANDVGLPPINLSGESTLWTIVDDSCHLDISQSSLSSKSQTIDSIGLNTSVSSAVRATIENGLNNVECRETSLEQGQSPGDAEENSDESESAYSTCSGQHNVANVDASVELSASFDRMERHTTTCGGSNGQFDEVYRGYHGIVSHKAWDGDVVYSREYFRHYDAATTSGTANNNYQEREVWTGVDISCERTEELLISCSTAYPSLDSLKLIDNRGFVFSRRNSIDGWASAEDVIPNAPANPSWSAVSASSGCVWRESDTWSAPSGKPLSTGRRFRDYTVGSFGATPSVGAWQLASPAIGVDTRTKSRSCPPDFIGRIRIKEERRFISNSPGSGSWGNWRVVSRSSSCEAVAPPDNNVGGGTPLATATNGGAPADGTNVNGGNGNQTCTDYTACTLFDELVLGNYQAMFGRPADAEGALYWTNQKHNLVGGGMSEAEADALIESQMLQAAIRNGENIVSNTNSTKLKVSDMPSDSMYADRVLGNYEALFGRQADGEGAMFWTNALHQLKGSGLSDAEANKKLDEMMLRAGERNGEEIVSSTGSSTILGSIPLNVDAISGFVANLYESNLVRDADGQGGIFWERQRQSLVSSGMAEADAQRQIEAQFRTAARDNGEQTKTSSFVNNLYSDNLGRAADSEGAKFWDSHYDKLVGSGMTADEAQRRVESDFLNAAKANGELQ